MSKTVISFIVAIAVIGASAGGYYFLTRTEVVRVDSSSTPLPPTAERDPKPKPNHGDFEKRFEPKPPPPNGGKLK